MVVLAELLSQLSSVRSRTAAAHNISTQLQQLEMQLHSTRYYLLYEFYYCCILFTWWPYLALPPWWACCSTCPALRLYQLGPMRIPK